MNIYVAISTDTLCVIKTTFHLVEIAALSDGVVGSIPLRAYFILKFWSAKWAALWARPIVVSSFSHRLRYVLLSLVRHQARILE